MRFLKIFLVIVFFVSLVVWLSYTFWEAYQPKPARIQGQIEAQQYNVSSKIAGRIDKVLVKKGDKVERGQMIFTLLSPELDAKLAQAEAGRDAAAAVAKEVNTGSRKQQIEAARDKWQQAKAAADLMEKTYKRIENLYKEGVIAEQQRDETYTKLQAARYSSSAAYQMYQLTKEGARNETKKAAEEKVRMAAGAVTEIEAYATETKIHTWHAGEVTQILLQTGEIAPQGFPVVTVMDMEDAWAVFHIREDLLNQYKKGTEFTVTIPALGNKKYTFQVTHVAVMGDFATWRATSNDSGFDMRSFEIEARPAGPIEDLRAGMSVLIVQ